MKELTASAVREALHATFDGDTLQEMFVSREFDDLFGWIGARRRSGKPPAQPHIDAWEGYEFLFEIAPPFQKQAIGTMPEAVFEVWLKAIRGEI